MRRLFLRFQLWDRQLFQWINGRLHNPFLNFWLYHLTFMGGASFTISISLLTWIFLPIPWSTAGAQAAVALAVSHIPVAIAKKIYPRVRPYIALPDSKTFRNPLSDYSFPSGHTTAAFATALPFMLSFPNLAPLFCGLSVLVGFSRIYLGLHYPSDVLAGVAIGSSVASMTVAIWS
ncbi:MAG TPA: phosphatase PAP2 family protein [Paenibacillus sp.]